MNRIVLLGIAAVAATAVGAVHAQSQVQAPAQASPARAAQAPADARPSAAAQPPAAAKDARSGERVQLDPSRITGSQELPRVLYIVPWRQSGAGEADGRPVNSLLYAPAAPVDRAVLRRESAYHGPTAPAQGKPAP